jgi:hypothetical protein
MNAPFFGLVVLFQWLLPSSFLTLRLPALVHSLLAPALGLLLFRRRGWRFAGFFAAALFVLPIHIGYARFAWDASAVPTVMVLALAAAMERRAWLTALAFALCLWVHPVTVFALPMLLAPFVMRLEDADGRAKTLRLLAWGVLAVPLVALAAAALLRFGLLPNVVAAALRGDLPRKIADRLTSPGDLLHFVRLYADLLLGPTLYRYITGSLPDTIGTLHLAFGLTLMAALSVAALPRLVRGRRSGDIALLLGLGASVFVSYAIGGLQVLAPGTERYGMFLTVPACYLLASFADVLADARSWPWVRAALCVTAALLLLSFQAFYVEALRQPDLQRHDTFRTGEVEPKLAAWDALLALRDPSRPAIVLAQDWWIYWPVRYLAHDQPNLRVTIPGMPKDRRFPADFAPLTAASGSTQLFGIAWADGAFDRTLTQLSGRRAAVYGYESGAILRVHLIDQAPASGFAK